MSRRSRPTTSSLERREFLTAAAAMAAAIGLPAPFRIGVSRNHRETAAGRYVDLALRCARWIDQSAQDHDTGLRWPADPGKPESVGLDFYNGMPGVVGFFAALHQTTGDPQWLDRARRGGDALIAAAQNDELDCGLYTGLAGIGWTLRTVARAGGGERFREAADRITSSVIRRARTGPGGAVSWSESHDIISGAAGTSLYLLSTGRADAVAAAGRAGRGLVRSAETAQGGLMWFPAASFRRNYPNFSHGTAGVGYALATIHRAAPDRQLLDAALAAARYLDAVATRRDGGIRIFHQSEGGEDRFYLSWCHGPPGTARLFHQLGNVAPEGRWADWVAGLTRGVFDSGAPEQRSSGYWNNISQCCGNVGIGQFSIDLTRYRPSLARPAVTSRVLADTMARGTDDESGLRWVQAENRTQPENVIAQTGFMQGAAGVGTFLLQLDALERGRPWAFPLPDTPFTG